MEKAQHKDRKPHFFFKHDAKHVNQKPDSYQQTRKKVSVKAVVTGGAGHFGFTLGCALAKSGTNVVIYDIQKPLWHVPEGVVFIQADVRHYNDLYAACEGADCVIHAAAYGMTGVEQLHKKHIRSVNIGGTGIVIEVCKQLNIPRLIYTSTINVVFAGQNITDGDEESVPYFPLDKHFNEYSRTKAIAEQMVLAANGSFLIGGGRLYTAALRPPGIYGPEEQRHLPRLALNIQRGLFMFRFGDPNHKMNWVHVKNLVQAHILAADALTAEKNFIAGGQAYFINDGENVNLFEWLSPLFERQGFRQPRFHCPIFGVFVTAVLMEVLHKAVCPLIEIAPLITLNEVHNFNCMHTFKIDKARRQLGYAPKKYTFADCVDHYLSKNPPRRNFFLLKCFLCMVLIAGLIILALRFKEVSVVLQEILKQIQAKYQNVAQ